MAATETGGALDALREEQEDANLLFGFGPLAVAAVLLALMVLLVPSVAPERIVERSVPDATATTTAPATSVAP